MNSPSKRMVYMISDGTGITVESLSNSLMSQFESVQFEKIIFPFVDSTVKITAICEEIEQTFAHSGIRPLVFMTLVNPEIRACIQGSSACVFDLFDTFLSPLEEELGVKASVANVNRERERKRSCFNV